MFPTFTGSSRRPRNVNLSGQKNTNPFAGAAPGTPSPVAKSLADARQHRALEKLRNEKAVKIQKAWRRYRYRRNCRAPRRAEFDDLYSPESMLAAEDRIPPALRLLLFFFDASVERDLDRLSQLARDLDQTSLAAFEQGRIFPGRLITLSRVIIKALDVASPKLRSDSLRYLRLLNAIANYRPQVFTSFLKTYYTVLGRCCYDLWEGPPLSDLVGAIVGPLDSRLPASSTGHAYYELLTSFLSQPEIIVFEHRIHAFAKGIDMERLSETVLKYYSETGDTVTGDDKGLWVLAHFVALLQANPGGSLHPVNFRALYVQLSTLSSLIRIAFPSADDHAVRSSPSGLPVYIYGVLHTLITDKGIADLLARFNVEYSGKSEQGFEDASLLAAYTLTIIRSFPARAERIQEKLYFADIRTPQGDLPAVRFFWKAMSNTTVFNIIKSGEDPTLDLLRRRKSQGFQDMPKWDEEWRSILFFLEMYVFVLTIIDDDDFFGGLDTTTFYDTADTRARQNCLSMPELQELTLFLKHLSFTLLYYGAQLNESDSVKLQASEGLEHIFSPSPTLRPAHPSPQTNTQDTFSVISGMDFNDLKKIITTSMRMLYERDSRRRFLPEGHWLMTSKFNMDSFEQAVLLEEERLRQLRDSADRSDDDETEDEDFPEPSEFRSMDRASIRRSRNARSELLRKQQRRADYQRREATAGPKLEILRQMPFAIPFETRVKIFRQFVSLDKQRRRGGHVEPDSWRAWMTSQADPFGMPFMSRNNRHNLASHAAKVKRGQVFRDAMEQFFSLGEGLKEPIQITFVDQFDTVEAGIDGGGVTKEFLMSVTKEAFMDQHGLLVANDRNAFYPNPSAVDQRHELLRQAGIVEGSPQWFESVNELLHQYEFLGRIIGKCLYEGILIDIVFAPFFLLKWASSGQDAASRVGVNDLRDMDEGLYQGLMGLKRQGEHSDISELGLDYTIEDQISLPGEPVRTVTRNLVSDGPNVLVTNQNRGIYTKYVAAHRLEVQPQRQTKAFLKGLGTIIDTDWLSMFNQNELQRLVGGDSSEINVEDLRANTQYSGVYQIGDDGEEHETVRMFWAVMHELSDRERRDVLKYVTSTPRAPLLGFSQLRPAFTIRDGGGDEDRLPSASTCVNLLKLPRYTSAETLKSKLLYAVTSGAGFDLS